MDLLRLGVETTFEQNLTFGRMKTETTALASGLRINTAADDPSGLAIATSMQTISEGLDQGSRDIQTGANALTVADGAMQTVTEILQRMRALVVEANSDLLSVADVANLQAEVTQLADEINAIASKTEFNGTKLLDGSLTGTPPRPALGLIPANPALDLGGLFVDPSLLMVAPGAMETEVKFSVDSFDPTTGNLNVTITANSSNPNFGPVQTASLQIAEGSSLPVFPPIINYEVDDQSGNPILNWNINNLDRNDVGKYAYIVTVAQQVYTPGHAAEIAVGNTEGNTVSVDIGSLSANDLGVGGVVLGDNITDTGAEYRIDYALQQVGAMRASVGAQTVGLQQALTDAQNQSVAQQASESNIRDLDVAQEVTAYTKDQILFQFQDRLLADANRTSVALMTLLIMSAKVG